MINLSPTTFKKIKDCPLQYQKYAIDKEYVTTNERLFLDYNVIIDFLINMSDVITSVTKQNMPNLVYNLNDEQLKEYYNEVFNILKAKHIINPNFHFNENESWESIHDSLFLTCKVIYEYFKTNKILNSTQFKPKYPLGSFREPIKLNEDVCLFGTIDMFIRKPDGIVALKFKSSLTSDKFIDLEQLKLYSFIMKVILTQWNKPYINVYYAYFLPKTNQYKEFLLTNDDFDEMTKLINEGIATIKSKKFYPKPSREKCIVCSYRDNCEFKYKLADDENMFDILHDLDIC